MGTKIVRVHKDLDKRLNDIALQFNRNIREVGGGKTINKTDVSRAVANNMPNINIQDVLQFRKRNRMKKGTPADILYISVFVLIIAIVWFFGHLMMSQINDSFESSGTVPQAQIDQANDLEARMPAILQGIFLFVIIGLSIVALLGAFAISTHPAFYFISIIILIIITVVSALISDVFIQTTSNPILADIVVQYPIIDFIVGNLAIYVIILSSIIAIVTYAKTSQL